MEKYQNYSGKSGCCYSTYWIGFDKEEVINSLSEHLSNLNKKIKDSFKRKQANNIVFSFKSYLEESELEKINHIFLFNQDLIEVFTLSKKQLKIAKEWELKNNYISYDDHFMVDYLHDLFDEETIYHILRLDNKKGFYQQITETKQRIIYEKDIKDIKDCKDVKFDLIHGISSNLKEFKNSIKKVLSKEELLDEINKRIMTLNHEEIEQILTNLTNPEWENKLVFGKKDISKSLQYSEIKTLFITSKKMKKIKKNLDINFKVIIVDKLKSGDIGDIFKNNYDGLLGIKYF